MEVTIQNSKEDYLGYFRYYYFEKNILDSVLFIIAISLILGFTLSITFNNVAIACLLIFLVLSMLLFFVLHIGPYIANIQDLNTASVENKYLLSEIKLTKTDLGLKIEKSGKEERFLSFGGIKQIGINKEFIFIYSFRGSLLLVPLRCFSSDKDASDFYNAIRSRYTSKLNKAYYLGLLRGICRFGIFNSGYF